MPEVSIRFGVKDNSSGTRSSTWKCWTTKSDVYLLNRALGNVLKTSLHESGDWRVAYDRRFLDREVDGDSHRAKNRIIDRWPRPQEISPGITLAYRIVVPHSAVNIPLADGLPSNVVWIPAPPSKKAIETSILITDSSTAVCGWPGRRSMQTQLVGSMDLENNSKVWLVHKQADIPTLPSRNVSLEHLTHFKSGMNINLKEPGFRDIAFGIADGSRYIMECAVEISEDAVKKIDDFRQRVQSS